MDLRILRLFVIGLAALLIVTACQSKAPTPSVDAMATAVAQAASVLLTQTAAAASPTPPPPTVTITPSPTETETVTPTLSGPPRLPQTVNFAGCYFGPGPSFTLESNISKGKGVELLGVGSVPGWYIIRNPYFHRPCWISVNDLKIFPGTDPSTFPVMTPGEPLMGQ
jgi:hypothetical protein